MKLVYTTDISGDDILNNGDDQVMMEWEKPYMEKCIEVLEPSGSVLEIGFGFGYSARKICSYASVTSYTVVECAPVVWEKFEEFKEKLAEDRPELVVNVIKGRWQDVMCSCGKYDTIFFDDFIGLSTEENLGRFDKFLCEALENHTFIGSKIASYSTTNARGQKINCVNVECQDYSITVPKNCKYAKGNNMYIPLFTKTKEFDEDCRRQLLKKSVKNEEQLNKCAEFYKNRKNIYCNLLVIDNFYNNPYETRKHILTQPFDVKGNYPGSRTVSYATTEIRNIIQDHIRHFAGEITKWPMEKDNNNYNGCFQYATSRDRTWIHNDGFNNWAGVLFLTPDAPVSAGTGIYKFIDGTCTKQEAEARGNIGLISESSQDYTKWTLVDRIGNIFNRLVLFEARHFHASMDYFGTNKENSRLFQTFFFSTEKEFVI
jgi:hypothetical protein